MAKLILTRGIPASGKSTYARTWLSADKQGRMIISRDDLRKSLFNGRGILGNVEEAFITRVQRETVLSALRAGRDVMVHDMHLRDKYIREWYKIWDNVTIEDFGIDVHDAIERDSKRRDHVGEDVIRTLYSKFTPKGVLNPAPQRDVVAGTDFKQYVAGPMKAFSVDLDGTMALFDGVRGPYDTNYENDLVCEPMRDTWNQLISGDVFNYTSFIILTGRNEDHREAVTEWLNRNGIYFDLLLMRPSDQPRTNDAIVKNDLVDKYISDVFDIRMHFDDRNRVVSALRSKGLTVSQIAEGDF